MGILGRLNGILNFIENPCNEPWTVFVEAAQPWANKAAISFLGVDVMQTVRTATSPGALRSGRHMRRGVNNEDPAKAHLPGIPDPYEYIGHIIRKPIDDFIHANATWGSKAIFSVVGVVEQGLWQYMLFDEATKFLYHSLADARKSEYCRRWNNGDGLRSGPIISDIVTGWYQFAIPSLKYASGAVELFFNGCIVNDQWTGRLHLVASFSGFALGGSGTQVHGMRITNTFTGETVAEIDPRPFFTGEAVEFVLDASADAPCELVVTIYQELGFLAGEGILFANFSGNRKQIPVPPHKKINWPHRPKRPRRPKNNVYTTSDGSEVIQTKYNQLVKPPKKPKP